MRAFVEARGLERIRENDFGELMRALAPVSESYLRHLVRETGLPLDPLAGGIRQDSFEHLEGTLVDMHREYAAAMAAGDGPRAKLCRQFVITAKDHAKFSLRSSKLSAERRATKEEMVLWMMTWLENPGVFETWVRLRLGRGPVG